MKIPFVDLHAQYLSIKPEIDAAIADVIAQTPRLSGALTWMPLRRPGPRLSG